MVLESLPPASMRTGAMDSTVGASGTASPVVQVRNVMASLISVGMPDSSRASTKMS